MVKIIALVILCLALATPAYAFRIDNTIIRDTGEEAVNVTNNSLDVNLPSGVSGGTVKIDTVAEEAVTKVFGTSTSIYSISVAANPTNKGAVWIGDSGITGNTGMLVTVTGSPVRVNTDNLNDLYFWGRWKEDRVHYIVELR